MPPHRGNFFLKEKSIWICIYGISNFSPIIFKVVDALVVKNPKILKNKVIRLDENYKIPHIDCFFNTRHSCRNLFLYHCDSPERWKFTPVFAIKELHCRDTQRLINAAQVLGSFRLGLEVWTLLSAFYHPLSALGIWVSVENSQDNVQFSSFSEDSVLPLSGFYLKTEYLSVSLST